MMFYWNTTKCALDFKSHAARLLNDCRESKDYDFSYEGIYKLVVIYCILLLLTSFQISYAKPVTSEAATEPLVINLSNTTSASPAQMGVELPVVGTKSTSMNVNYTYTAAKTGNLSSTSAFDLPGEVDDNHLHGLRRHHHLRHQLHRPHPRSPRTAYEILFRNVAHGSSTICLQITSVQATAGDCLDNLGKSIPLQVQNRHLSFE